MPENETITKAEKNKSAVPAAPPPTTTPPAADPPAPAPPANEFAKPPSPSEPSPFVRDLGDMVKGEAKRKVLQDCARIYQSFQDSELGLSGWAASLLAAHLYLTREDAELMGGTEAIQWADAFRRTMPFCWMNVRNGDVNGFLAKLRIQGTLPRAPAGSSEEDANAWAAQQSGRYGAVSAAIRG